MLDEPPSNAPTRLFVSLTVTSPGAVTAAPFLQMSKRLQPAANSILLTRPTNAFSGIYAAARQRNLLFLATALMAVAAELLPILLANVPFALTLTLATAEACTRAALAVLAAMVLLLVASLFVRWPHMPVDPRTVAGAAYYVAGSGMLRELAGRGLSTLERRERDRLVEEMGRRYVYQRVKSSSGRSRVVVDSVEQ